MSFISTQSKGKKNDHVTHNTFLEHMLSHYKNAGIINFTNIKHIIGHTDNCPTQYKCR